jgi:hypothetical protein
MRRLLRSQFTNCTKLQQRLQSLAKIVTHIPSKQKAVDPRFRPRGPWDQHIDGIVISVNAVPGSLQATTIVFHPTLFDWDVIVFVYGRI